MEQTKVTDDLLCKAFQNLSDEMIDEWENQPEVKHSFSKKFERRMKTLILKEKNKDLLKNLAVTGKRVSVVAAALIIVIIIFSINSIDAKADPKLWFQKIEVILEDSSMYIYDKEEDAYYFKPYEPTYIPEGYTETERFLTNNMFKIDYEDSIGGKITWYQNMVMNSTAGGMNTEYKELKIMEYAGENIYIYVYEDGYKFLYFESECSIFTMSTTNVSIEDMYNMIKDMKWVEE